MGFAAKESVFALAALLKDPEAEVRDAAAMALAQLGRRAECAVGAMVESSRAPPDRRCLKATLALASIGEPAVPALIGLLKADDPAVRRAVIQGIEDAVHAGCWHECGAVARTIGTHYQSLARDPDPGVRFALASMLVLTRSDSPLVLSALGQLLSDPDSDVRLAVATSVGKYSWLPAGLRGSFLELLKDGELDVRVAAARAVPQPDLVAPVVIDRLLAALKDPDPRVRAAAAVKLAEARYTAREMDSRRRPVATVVYTSAALSHHPAAGRILTSALEDSRLEARVAAAHLSARLPRRSGRRDPSAEGETQGHRPGRSSRGGRGPRRARPGFPGGRTRPARHPGQSRRRVAGSDHPPAHAAGSTGHRGQSRRRAAGRPARLVQCSQGARRPSGATPGPRCCAC